MPAFRRLSLPSALRTKLVLFCNATGEDPSDVLADAVTLHLDELGELVDEPRGRAAPDAAGALAAAAS